MEYQRVAALLELSGLHPTSQMAEMLKIAQAAPDPETAVSHFMSGITVTSPLLQTKWRKHISQIWFASHPHVPANFDVPLKSSDVTYSHALLEAHTLLQEISIAPLATENTPYGHILAIAEEEKIAQTLSVFRGDAKAVRRAVALLDELRLIRLYQHQFQIVRSRTERFQNLPITGQFYLLWHVDMYHLDWRRYEGQYGDSLAVFQQYLPMVWELLAHHSEGSLQRIDELTWQIVRAFRPLWREQRIGLYEQSLLQHMVETQLVQKVLLRYGLIVYENDTSFTWTSAGEALLEAERTASLPCIADLLT